MKMLDFLELKLGNMTKEEYGKKIIELLSYVVFIKVEILKLKGLVTCKRFGGGDMKRGRKWG